MNLHLHPALGCIWLLLLICKLALLWNVRRCSAPFFGAYATLEPFKTVLLMTCGWMVWPMPYAWIQYGGGFISHAIVLGVALSCYVELVGVKVGKRVTRLSAVVLALLAVILVYGCVIGWAQWPDADSRLLAMTDQAFTVLLCGIWIVLLIAAKPLEAFYTLPKTPSEKGHELCYRISQGFAALYFSSVMIGLLPVRAGWGPKMAIECLVIGWWIYNVRKA